MNDPAAVTLEELSAGYPGVLALDQVDLAIAQGRITALLGANGSGKSTLMSSILGVRAPIRGSVRIFGQDPAKARRRNLVSYVPQHEQIDTTFPITVEQVVLMGRYRHMGITRRARAADHQAVDEAIEHVRLEDFRKRSIGELSGGQRKRAFVARSIAQHAPLMLLDEPFAGVDRASEDLIAEVLRDLRSTSGTTLLISTHHLEGVEDLADHAVLLHQRVLAEGTPAEVLDHERLGSAFGAVLSSAGSADPPETGGPTGPAAPVGPAGLEDWDAIGPASETPSRKGAAPWNS